jgi:hypothetical protein
MTTTTIEKLENGFKREVFKTNNSNGIFNIDEPMKYIKTIYDKKGKKLDNFKVVL